MSASPARVRRTTFLARLQRDVMSRPFAPAGGDLPTEERVALEARLLGPTYRLLRRLAQLMSIAAALARGRQIAPTPRARRRVFERGDFGLGPEGRTRRWARAHDLDAAAHQRLVERLATLGALLERCGGRQSRRVERYVLALLRIDGRYEYWRGLGPRGHRRAERAVGRSLRTRSAEELRLYRLTAALWRVLDDAARERGVAPPDDVQDVADEFRRARDLMDARRTRDWLRANDLDRRRFSALAAADARLSLVLDGAATSALRLEETMEPVFWWLDAIRLGGFYPALARGLTRLSSAHQPALSPDPECLVRDHCARVGEPAPTDVEQHARALDFPGGGPELLAALGSIGRPLAMPSTTPTLGHPVDWEESRARRFLVRPGCRDTEGRPLAEGNLDGAASRPPVELRTCSYPGSRFQHRRPMNVSALRHLAEHWPEMIRTAAYLRRLHLERYPHTGRALLDAYWIAATLANVPNYLLRRAVDPIRDDGVPPPIANLYKAALGVSGIAYAMCVSQWAGARGPGGAAHPADIHAYAERTGALVGETEVCAGPPDLIRRFLDVVTAGDDDEAARATWIRDLLPAPDRCLEYGTAMVRMTLVRQLTAVRHLAVLDVLEVRLARSLPAMAKRLAMWRGQREPWASLGHSPDHEVTRWIASRDARTREAIVAGVRDLIGRLDTAGASRVPSAFFQAVQRRALSVGRTPLAGAAGGSALPRRHRGWLTAILAYQVEMTRLHERALETIAIEQGTALGRAGEASRGIRPVPGAPASEFLARELGGQTTADEGTS